MNMLVFHAALDLLLELNKENCKRFSSDRIGKLHYLLEFATVRVNIGRQAGVTSYIRSRVQDNGVVVVPRFNVNNLKNAVTPDELMQGLAELPEKIGTVWIDCPSAVFRQIDRVNLYRTLINLGDPDRIVLLGD